MKVVVQILFLLFYVASGYAAGQKKLVRTVDAIHHSNSQTDEPQIGAEGQRTDRSLPKYREAKKVNKDFENRPVTNVVLAPSTTTRQFTAPNVRFTTQFALDRSNPRAPPLLS